MPERAKACKEGGKQNLPHSCPSPTSTRLWLFQPFELIPGSRSYHDVRPQHLVWARRRRQYLPPVLQHNPQRSGDPENQAGGLHHRPWRIRKHGKYREGRRFYFEIIDHQGRSKMTQITLRSPEKAKTSSPLPCARNKCPITQDEVCSSEAQRSNGRSWKS